MKPPAEINVIDRHGGFTDYDGMDTCWIPSKALKKGTIGALESFDESSFYQTNNDVTRAIYRVKGYKNPVWCWFRNDTGERIA